MTVQMTSRPVPGVGVSEQLDLRDGHRLAIMIRRDGSHDLSTDAGAVHLDEDEADAVARTLGSAKLVARLSRVQHAADAVRVEQLPIPRHSPYCGLPLGDTRIRHRTGVSIVAVLRDGGAQPSPKPDYVLEPGDLVVAVGTREGLDQAGHILDGTG